jgi:hypothetical protein
MLAEAAVGRDPASLKAGLALPAPAQGVYP